MIGAAPPSLYLVCAFCHGPILVVKEGKKWNHASPRVSSHDAMPEPEGKKGKVVHVNFSAERLAIWDDAKKTLGKEFWLGPFTVTNPSEGYLIELAVEDKDATEVLRRGYECGLGRKGYVRVNPKKAGDNEDVGGDQPSNGAANTSGTRKSGGTASSRPARSSSGASSEVKTWWQCPNPDCKRHIKSGAEFHYGKSAKCAEYAKAKGLSLG